MSIETLTDAQREAWLLHTEEGLGATEIARRLNRNESTIRERLAQAKRKVEETDPAVAEAMAELGIKTVPRQIWFKTKKYSAKVEPEKEIIKSHLELVADAMRNLPAAMKIPAPRKTVEDLMTVYPIFDLHLGMRAHAAISGTEVTLESAKAMILTAMADVMDAAPNSRRAVIINGGDFTHQTDDMNRTRRSGHILDVDGRNSMTVDAGLEVLFTLVEMALRKHQTVEYYSVPGNHDPQNWETIQFAMRERYRNNPRVIINVRWDEFSVVEHGKVGLFIHHGDKRTPKDLVMFCQARFKDVIARTDYNMLLTGHLHHLKQDEFPGMIWHQISTAAARDHHAASHAYLSLRLIYSMTFNLTRRMNTNEFLI